jgi:phytoene synthase
MTLQSTTPAWERHLLVLAQDAFCVTKDALRTSSGFKITKNQVADEAIAACEAITAEHSRSFYLATSLLPREKRRAMRVLYAFCRTADNLVDGNVEQPAAKLLELRRSITGQRPFTGDPVLSAWFEIQAQYHIPLGYAEQLLDGMERDLVQRRYQTFEDLSVYCYRVASTVGLMSMHITEFSDQRAIPYAIKLGVALQLTNILRDVGEDWNSGRLYIPLDELSVFSLDENDVAAARVDKRWRDLMRFQIARARRLYAEAMPGIALLNPDGRFAVAAAATLYKGILDDIEVHDFDVFSHRAYVRQGRKLALLPQAFRYTKMEQRRKVYSYLED